ncbi:MAG: response regulator [Actinomycetota bacterium]|nr:response regulator [Actinomycetota bacterium]
MKTVLVIDDDPDIRDLVIWKLSQAGYATLAEGDGEAGLVAACGGTGPDRSQLPDLILVDWMMPKLSGIDLCRALRDNPRTTHIPVILLTAKAQEAEVERGRAAGADDYIVKPFSPKEMLKRVEALLVRAPPPR